MDRASFAIPVVGRKPSPKIQSQGCRVHILRGCELIEIGGSLLDEGLEAFFLILGQEAAAMRRCPSARIDVCYSSTRSAALAGIWQYRKISWQAFGLTGSVSFGRMLRHRDFSTFVHRDGASLKLIDERRRLLEMTEVEGSGIDSLSFPTA